MHGLPRSFDASEFVGKKVEEVCFSENTINLLFERNIAITILGSYFYRAGSDMKTEKQVIPVIYSNLMGLAGKVVQTSEANIDGTLTLYFNDEHVLTLVDDSPQYECYSIRINDREIIV